jgi:hypothetical protein
LVATTTPECCHSFWGLAFESVRTQSASQQRTQFFSA